MRVLDSVTLAGGVGLDVDLGAQGPETARLLATILKRRFPGSLQLPVRFGLDPLGAAGLAGGLPQPWREYKTILHGLISDLVAEGFRGPFAVADGRLIHNAGGSEAQELAGSSPSAL